MRFRRLAVLSIFVLGAAGQHSVLRAWLEAFNSGERERIHAYLKKSEPSGSLRGNPELPRADLAGSELLSVDKSERLTVQFHVKEKNGPNAVKARRDRGEYDAITDGDDFAQRLTHLHVSFSAAPLRLSSNIGYVKFNMFADPDFCGPTAIAAMNFLANLDALIFDLRENSGGDPKIVALISSYLFAGPTHLNDLYNRKENSTEQFWTMPYVPGKRFTGKPVFVP